MHKTITLALSTAVLLACFTTLPASAGADTTRNSSGVGRCFPETDPSWNLNTMYCQGTMAGIRAQQTDSSRFAIFSIDTNGQLYFGMVVNRVGYTCFAPASMTEIWRTAIATNGWFSISYDKTTGVCKALTVGAGSASKTAL
ncbi:MAG TPA: hypothetical protein VFZ95_04955 [Steroidobacteraceae bacterium]